MRQFTGLLLAIVLLCVVYPAQAAPTAQWGAFLRVHPDAQFVYEQNQPSPRLIHGFAEAMPPALTPQAQAVEFLNRHRAAFGIASPTEEFVVGATRSLGERRMVRLDQQVKGVPVLNGGVHVVMNRDGEVIRVHNHYSPAARLLSTVPTISASEAITTAWAAVYQASTYDISARARSERNTALYVWTLGDFARLVYVVALPTGLRTEKRIALVDAATGDFLLQRNLVVHHRANAFMHNPGANGSGSTTEVTIMELLPDQPHTEGPLVRALNCPDEGEIRQINIGIALNIPMCTEKHLATADDNGDFLFNPVMAPFTNPASHADEFSEVHLYYHVELFYHFLQDLARHIDDNEPPFETLEQLPLHAVANFKMPDLSALMGGGTVKLVPFDNAFFVPQFGLVPGEYPEQDAIVFGQGTTIDMAYDADVIYHEFVHATINSTIKLEQVIVDQYGLATDPGAINEGYADYFSATFSGNALMAEFVGSAFGMSGALRDLENSKKCPDDVHGEVHDDSEWFSAALWELRQEYKVSDSDHWDIDAAIFSALLELPSAASYTVAALTTIDQMEAWFGTEAAAFAEEVFNRRGLIDCNRAIPISDGTVIPRVSVYDTQTVRMNPFVPGFTQFHASLPDGGRGITMTFRAQGGGGIFGGGTVTMDVLARHGQPVTFSYGQAVSANHDWKVAVNKISSAGGVDTYEAVLANPDGTDYAPGEWYFAFAVKTAGGGMMGAPMLQHLTFAWGCATDDECGDCNVCAPGGVCQPPESECATDDDCGPLEACVAEGCIMVCERRGDACVTGRDCADCQTCVDGVCMDIATECRADEDCEDGETCVIEGCAGTCTPAADGDSPDGDIPDGDEADGDEAPGPGAAGGSGGCQQSGTTAGWGLLLLGLALVLRRRIA